MAQSKKDDNKKNTASADAAKAKTKANEKPKAKTDEKSKEKGSKTRGLKYLGGFLFSKMAAGGAAELRSNADHVNKLNVFPVPDGDTGDNMRMTIESGISAIENLKTDNLAEVMRVFSKGMLLGARGNSGVILSQFFAGTAKGFEGIKKTDPKALGHALEMGVKQAYTSVMTPTEGTILTVAREAVEYAVRQIKPDSTIRTFFADLVKETHASLERTPEILTVLKEAEVVDSGGAGLFYILDGFNRVLNGEEIAASESAPAPSAPSVALTTSFGPDSEMTYGYCTELLVQLLNKKTDIDAFDVEALKAFLAEIGDSVVAFKTDSIVKIHVHTFTPERVLAHMREFGEFLTVKIENMSVQHTSTVTEEADADTAPEAQPTAQEKPAYEIPRKKYGVVAVCNGDGIESLFRELGTDQIVNGGQTQNPSTNDFLEAFELVYAEHIFVFPNNSNIFMAAGQAAELYDKAQIHVIPSKNIGTGYVAVASADFENPDPEAIAEEMKAAMARVKAGYVSPSIRDAEIGGVQIKKGDTIGIVDKEIVVSAPERENAAMALVERLLADGERFMLTVFTGKDATAEECDALKARLEAEKSELEIYFVEGGQDIYPYIFVAE